MAPTIRALAWCALVTAFSPALASACDEATAEAAAKAMKCEVKTRIKAEVKASIVIGEAKSCVKAIEAQPVRRSGWTPGHLIEPDSMRLGPGDDLKVPDAEQWVILSSRGTIHFRHVPRGSKKTEGRTLQQYGPYRS